MTIGDHPQIRRLYAGFPRTRVASPLAVAKVIGGKRSQFHELIIRNYQPPKIPPYTTVATEPTLLDLFGDGKT